MDQEIPPAVDPAVRNRAARTSLVAAIFFLTSNLVLIASNSVTMTSWARNFLKANPDHALTFFLGLMFEVTFLVLPFNFLASLTVILVGVRGLKFASRSGGGAGRRSSIIGIGLSSLVMLLSVVGFFQWGSAFRQ